MNLLRLGTERQYISIPHLILSNIDDDYKSTFKRAFLQLEPDMIGFLKGGPEIMALPLSRFSEKDQACVQTILLPYFSKWGGKNLIFFLFYLLRTPSQFNHLKRYSQGFS